MQYLHDTTTASSRLPYLLDELSAGCDPEFDTGYEELEREFSDLHLQLASE